MCGKTDAGASRSRRDAPASKAATAAVLKAHDRLVQLAGNAPGARRSRTAALLIVGMLLVGVLLGGCARVRAALAVQPDDTVTGEPQLWPRFVERYTTLRKLPLPPSVAV